MTLNDFIRRAKYFALIARRAHYVETCGNGYRVTTDPASLSTVVFSRTFSANHR